MKFFIHFTFKLFIFFFCNFFNKLLFLFKKNYKTGTCSYVFLIFYGIFRIFSEFFREPDAQIGYLFNLISMGTILSFFMILAGTIIFLKKDDIK